MILAVEGARLIDKTCTKENLTWNILRSMKFTLLVRTFGACGWVIASVGTEVSQTLIAIINILGEILSWYTWYVPGTSFRLTNTDRRCSCMRITTSAFMFFFFLFSSFRVQIVVVLSSIWW